jgi:hypothetical protein
MFELECDRGTNDDSRAGGGDSNRLSSPSSELKNILLKGQMKYIKDVNALIFLCSPV